MNHSLNSRHFCSLGNYILHISLYIISTSFLQSWVEVSRFGGAAPCHWSGLMLQLDSQPLEGDGVSSCCWRSSRSVSSDRKLGNVCARGMKVIVRPLPVGGEKAENWYNTFWTGLSVSLTGPLHKTYFLFTWKYVHGTQLLSYCSCWYLSIQRKTARIILANLKTSDVGGVHIIKLSCVTATNIDYNFISMSSAEPYCVELSPLCPHSLALHLNLN